MAKRKTNDPVIHRTIARVTITADIIIPTEGDLITLKQHTLQYMNLDTGFGIIEEVVDNFFAETGLNVDEVKSKIALRNEVVKLTTQEENEQI